MRFLNNKVGLIPLKKQFITRIRKDGDSVGVPQDIVDFLTLKPKDYVKITIEKVELNNNES